MRKTLLTLTALAGLFGAGIATSAQAAHIVVAVPAGTLVQPVQYYYGGYGRDHWREREWRHHEWERHHRFEEWRFHHRW